jgi:hypothetical protein
MRNFVVGLRTRLEIVAEGFRHEIEILGICNHNFDLDGDSTTVSRCAH